MSRLPALVFVCAALAAGTVAFAAPQIGKWGVDLTAIDPAVRPGDNFFDHVNGKWLATIQIPPDRSSIGFFSAIADSERTAAADHHRRTEGQAGSGAVAGRKKLRDLYDSFEDTDAIEAAGLKPAQKDIDYFSGLKTKADVARAMASVPLSTFSIYNIGIGVDDKHPDNYSVNLSQGGIGLPDRDYYLSDDKALVATREAYRKYLADMMTPGGDERCRRRADRVLALETEIAKVQWNRADRRDADKVYNPMPVSQLKTLAPDFPWDAFLSESHIPLTARPGEAPGHRGGKHRLRAAGQGVRRHPAFDLARLSDGALSAHFLGLSAEEIRRYRFRLLRHGAHRAAAAARPQDPGRASAGQSDGRKRWARFMSRAISRPKPRPRPTSWSPTCSKLMRPTSRP